MVCDAARSEIKDFRTALLTLAVARRKFPLGARIFFDRGAIAVSFPLPLAVIDRKASPIMRLNAAKIRINRFIDSLNKVFSQLLVIEDFLHSKKSAG